MKGLLSVILACVYSISVSQDYSLDRKLGEENSKLVEQEMGIYKHDSLQWLINSVGQKLVSRLKNKPFEFHFYLADSEEPNAFALPGGYIYVTRGILPLLQTEDELAGVMAHEIIHVMQRHSVKQIQKSMLTGILKLPGNLINSVTGTQLGNILNTPIGLVTGSYIAKYSRGHESESDKFGIQLAASAGYKTDALADALERLAKEVSVLTGEAEKRSYFSDHPYTPSRIAAIRNSAGMYKPVNPAPVVHSQQQFTRIFNGLIFGTNPAQGVFIDSLFVQPDLDFVCITPSRWTTVNKPSVVAAMQEKGESIVALQLTDNSKSPKQQADELLEKVKKQESITVLQATDTVINSLPAHIVRLKSVNKNNIAIMELIWLTYNKNIYQLTGIALPTHQKLMHQSLTSFKAATVQQRHLVKLYRVRVIAAHQNETLSDVSKRTDNRLVPELTEIFNNVKAEQALPKGSLIKVVTVEAYKPR